jgi:AhpD family alkylhydroperoxidase
MTVKTDMSRFDIHDELTAPEDSVKLLKGMASAGGSVSKFVGVLAGSPAALRAFARMRHELRGGELPRPTRERIALAVAEDRGDTYSIAQHARTARAAGLGLDEISRARSWSSSDPREAALLTFLKALLEADGRPAHHLLEEAREVDWSDE